MNSMGFKAAGALLLGSTALAGPALAQTAPAPRFITPDRNGVDLITLQPVLAFDEGGIGSGPGALRMQRIWAQEAGWVDNWTGGLFQRSGDIYVQVGGISDIFTVSNGVYTSKNAAGSTLGKLSNGKWLYTAKDGTTIEFDPTGSDSDTSCPGADANTCSIPIAITRPSGLKFRIDWHEDFTLGKDFFRLSSVKSSAGYRLVVNYVTDHVGPGPEPVREWYRRSDVVFDNVAGSPSPRPTTTYAYPSSEVIDVTLPGARKWRFTTTGGKLTGVERPGSSSDDISYSYGTGGLINSATVDGVTTGYALELSGQFPNFKRSVRATDALGNSILVGADTNGRPESYKDETGATTTYVYDGNARVDRVTAPEGNAVDYDYDDRGNVTSATFSAKPGSGLADITITASFDPTCTNVVKCNKPNSTTDALGNTTNYFYSSAHGRITSVTLPPPQSGAVRPQTRYSYQAIQGAADPALFPPVQMLAGVSACQTLASCTGGADESKTTAVYNSNLLPTSTSSGNGTGTLTATTAMAYDPRGNVRSIDGPLPGTADTWAFKYDAADQLVGTISPDPDGTGGLPNRAARTTYRPDGQVETQERGTTAGQSDADWAAFNPLETVQLYYDSNSRVWMQRLYGLTTRYTQSQFNYDELGRLHCTAVRMDRTEFTPSASLDACALGANTDPYDRISRLYYDSVGRHIKTLVGYHTPEQAYAVQKIYSDNGRLVYLFDGKENRTTYQYDGFDRLSKTFFPDKAVPGTSSTSDFEQLGYDANSNVISRRVRSGAMIGYGYDDLDRLTLKNLPGTEPDVTYAYDNLGRLTSASQPGNVLSFTYDALGRNLTQTGPQGVTCSEWDLAGRRTRLTYPASSCSASDAFFVTYSYLWTGDIRHIYEKGVTTGLSHLAGFGYDPLGNRERIERGNGSASYYDYERISRLADLNHHFAGTASDAATSFAYNPASQIISETNTNDAYAWTGHGNGTIDYTINGLNQVTSVGGGATTYDGNGNVTTDPTGAVTNYLYTSENLLRTAAGVLPIATLAYDPLMRLDSVIGNASGQGSRFAYDGLDMLAEYTAAGALQKRYVFVPGIDEPLVEYDAAGNRTWLTADERGSIISRSNDAGTVTQINRYGEFGEPQSTNQGRFQYTGQMWVPELAAYYYKSRVYEPRIGRFLQPDPIGYAGGMNLYAYVGNDPVNFVDPLGLQCIPVGNSTCSTFWPGGVTITGAAMPTGGSIASGNSGAPGRARSPRAGFNVDPTPEGKPQKTQPICTATQIRAQDIGEGIGAGGITGAKVGNLVQKGGVAVAAGSAFFLNPTGVLVGGEVAGVGTAIKATGYATAVFGYGVALAAGGNVRNEFNDAAVRLLPFSGIYPDSWKNGIKSGLTAAENAVGVPNTGCRR